MASGIKMNQQCKDMFTAIKDKHTHGHAIMKIKDNKEIIVEKHFEPHADKTPETSKLVFDVMRAEVLASGGPRYILFDFAYARRTGTSKDVVVYIYWCSDSNVTIKQKMVYASTNEVLKKAFHGIKHFEVHDEDEFSYEAIAEELSSKDRA